MATTIWASLMACPESIGSSAPLMPLVLRGGKLAHWPRSSRMAERHRLPIKPVLFSPRAGSGRPRL